MNQKKGYVSYVSSGTGRSHQNALSGRLEAVWAPLSYPHARGWPAQATSSALPCRSEVLLEPALGQVSSVVAFTPQTAELRSFNKEPGGPQSPECLLSGPV